MAEVGFVASTTGLPAQVVTSRHHVNQARSPCHVQVLLVGQLHQPYKFESSIVHLFIHTPELFLSYMIDDEWWRAVGMKRAFALERILQGFNNG